MIDEIFEMVMKEARRGPADDIKTNIRIILFDLNSMIKSALENIGESWDFYYIDRPNP